MDYERIAALFRRLAIEAGEEILDIYNRPDFEVRTKADSSPVTEADLRADAVISAGLRATFPEIPLVTEEQRATHDVSAPVFFIVDPLDGTKDFVRRGGDFTVNIALVEDGVPTRGVVYAPACDRLFYTAADGRAVEEAPPHLPAAAGATRAITVAPPGAAGLVVVASKSHRNAATNAFISRFNVADCRAAGSSLKFCLVATGEADLYPRLGPTMEWDTAAGQAVLAGAGGLVVRADDLSPLRYGKAGFENPHFIALSPGVDLQV